jgi:thiamine-phosphate pyrophosphorylase
VNDRLHRLRRARLYLVCDGQPDEFLHAVLRGGVDLVQLRMKEATDRAILATARRFKQICQGHGALLILNDRPDLVIAAGADGVHVGQDDAPVAAARAAVERDRIVGLSTHTRAQVDAASALGVDYIGVGPVYQTPTKPGRPAVGLELVSYAQRSAQVPFFAIGGISIANAAQVGLAGARRVAAVRALTDADDPEQAARRLKEALAATQPEEAPVGAT